MECQPAERLWRRCTQLGICPITYLACSARRRLQWAGHPFPFAAKPTARFHQYVLMQRILSAILISPGVQRRREQVGRLMHQLIDLDPETFTAGLIVHWQQAGEIGRAMRLLSGESDWWYAIEPGDDPWELIRLARYHVDTGYQLDGIDDPIAYMTGA